jgi:hypothetical protein
MSRVFCLIALALAAAAAAASIAQAGTANSRKPVDPLAVGYLMGRGLSPSEVKSWTVGACSHAAKPASCFAVLDRATAQARPKPVDPLAVGYLMGRGLSPSEVTAWTVGICSHATKPSLCFAPFQRTTVAAPLSGGNFGSDGFNWGDAGIGAGAALGIALLLTGMGAGIIITRHNRRRHLAGT